MTKISQLSSIGDSLAIGDQFLIRDIDDAGSPNKSVTVSGITRALADGDATAPALAFAADKNTGIYRAGTDSLAVATNGTGRLFVDATGNVGVGLTPASYAGYSVIGHGSTTGATLEQRVNGILVGSLTTDSQVTLKASTAIPIVFSTNNTERLRITSAGLVGIGTSSPATPLDVVGNIRAVTSATSATTVRIGNTGNNVFLGVESSTGGSNITGSTAYAGTITSNGPIQFSASNGGSVQATLDASGRLGIGTTAPNRKLEVSDAGADNFIRVNTTGATKSGIEFASGGLAYSQLYFTNVSPYDLSLLQQYTTGSLILGTNSTERARITSAGLVGIGSSSPTAKLESYFSSTNPSLSSNTGAGLSVYGTSTVRLNFGNYPASPYSSWVQSSDGIGNAWPIALNPLGGNVGIGTTSPLSPLVVSNGSNKNIEFQPGSTCYLLAYDRTASDYLDLDITAENLIFSTNNGTERARIDTSGRLGIGTSSPRVNVHILGTASNAPTLGVASGSLIVGPGDRDYGLAMGTAAAGYSWIQSQNFVSAGAAYSLLLQPSGGNVGIGTSSVNALLEVNSSTAGNEVQRIEGAYSGAGSVTLTNWRRAGGAVAAAFKYNDGTSPLCMSIGTTTSHQFRIRTADTDAITIDTSQRVGIGTTSPVNKFVVASSGAGYEIDQSSLANTNLLLSYDRAASAYRAVANYYGGTYSWNDAGSERARIDSSGRLLVGTSTARTDIGSSQTANIQTESTTSGLGYFTAYNQANAFGTVIALAKSRGTSVGSNTIVQSGDQIGGVAFYGADGVDTALAGTIECYVDGTPGSNDMPGRIILATTANGSSSPTERMRITSTGQVRLAGAGITFNGDTAAANELDDYEEGTWTASITGGTFVSLVNGRYTKVGRQVFASMNQELLLLPATLLLAGYLLLQGLVAV